MAFSIARDFILQSCGKAVERKREIIPGTGRVGIVALRKRIKTKPEAMNADHHRTSGDPA